MGPPSVLKTWTGQSWHCNSAHRLGAVLTWMRIGLQLRSLAGSLPGYRCLFASREKKKTTTSRRLNRNAGVRATFNRMWHPEELTCPPPSASKCLKKMEWTIMALQPCKETCCCVGMNAHGLQLKNWAGSLPGDTTVIVVYLPADTKRRLQLLGAWMEMLEWEQHSTECDTLRPWRPSMPSTKCLKKMVWTIMALQPCKETCCCVGMNAHGLQLGSLAGSLPGDTTFVV